MTTRLILTTIFAISFAFSSCRYRVFVQKSAGTRSGIVRGKQFTGTEGTFFWSHFDATKRSSQTYVKNGKPRVLAEENPDAVAQKAVEILNKAKVKDLVDAESQAKAATTIVQLGQRTASVNALGKALYRLAEFDYNHPEIVCGCDTCGCDMPVASAQTVGQKPSSLSTENQGGAVPQMQRLTRSFDVLFTSTWAGYRDIAVAEANAQSEQAKAEQATAKVKLAELELQLLKMRADTSGSDKKSGADKDKGKRNATDEKNNTKDKEENKTGK